MLPESIPFFSEEGVVFFGSIDLQFHQHLDEIRVARSLRPAEDQLEFVEMVVHERDKLVQVLGGKLQTVFCSPFRDEVKIIILCRLEAGEQLLCGLTHKVFKQSGLIRVVAVEGTFVKPASATILFRDASLKPFSRNSFFPNFEDLPLGSVRSISYAS